jgi:uncharacterized membrane protein YsdA (DUF1294 family)
VWIKIRYTLSGLLLTLTATLILEGALGWSLWVGWLLAINVFTLLFYVIDKRNSQSSITPQPRIPEAALLIMALAGGSPTAALAIVFLPHKIRQASFILPYLLVLALQAAAIVFLYEVIPWPWAAG